MKKSLLFYMTIFNSLFGNFHINPEKFDLLNRVFSETNNYIDITINNHHFSGTRPWLTRWNLIKNACSYEGLNILDLGCNIGLNCVFIKKYGKAKFVTGVDRGGCLQQGKILSQAFEAGNINFVYIDFNDTNVKYEEILGYDFDIIFCMSLIHWIHGESKERLLNYMSKFNNILFEGHESKETEINRFKKYGFNAKHLGYADQNRPIILFFKN